eukprot:TRINITY_DN1569_c0_g2_i1.p1 TRINITY_DN1569_c0_g2~~TRINITY_DN1569_c0_g2_i1.p1  ORF type:complete len:354 (-),score=56.16 TRINITY_DN1569_c0_g2_i1:34-969(-)
MCIRDSTWALLKIYQAKAQEMDFINKAEGSRKFINEAVSKATNKKILNLLPEGVITTNTRLVLTNCIYFKGVWKTKFPSENTYVSSFTLANNSIINVNMMRIMKAKFMYYEEETFQLLDLPYSGDEVSMHVLVPREGFQEDKMDTLTFNRWKNSMISQEVKLHLPKFSFEWSLEMNEILKKIGIKEIFSSQADLSGIDGDSDLYVSKVIQKTFIEVTEEGTEAAAATAVVANKKSALPQKKLVIADHPFIIFIIDHSTQEILFMGKVSNPGEVKSNFEVHLTESETEKAKQLVASVLGYFSMMFIGFLLVL